MAVFAYRAIDSLAADVNGTIAADTPRQARELLRERGLVVTDVTDYRDKPARRIKLKPTRSRGNRRHATGLIRELATLLGAGMPLLESLDTLARQHQGTLHAVVVMLRDRVSSGASLATAMADQPRVFDELCRNITEVGEDSGSLDHRAGSPGRVPRAIGNGEGAYRHRADLPRDRHQRRGLREHLPDDVRRSEDPGAVD